MMLLGSYVQIELLQVQDDVQTPASRHREQWLRWQQEARIERRRVMLRWVGRRLVGAGVRLQAWSEHEALNSERV